MTKPVYTHVIDDCLQLSPDWMLRAMRDRRVIQEAAARAERFILTEDASTKLGELILQAEPLLLANQQFAKPPFETTYIELNCAAVYKAMGRPTSTSILRDYYDDWVGYLLHKGRFWIFTRTGNGEFGTGPFCFAEHGGAGMHLNYEASDWINRIAKHAPSLTPQQWLKGSLLLGTSLLATDMKVLDEWLARWTVLPMFGDPQGRLYKDCLTLVTKCAGDVRTLVAVLLLLAQPEVIKSEPKQPRPLIRKGKRIVYHAHRTIDLVLSKRYDARRLFSRPSGIHVRQHPVRGHFAHYHLHPGCIHEWPELPELCDDGAERWRCKTCGGWRTWKKHYLRGDPTLGIVTHDYKVTA